MHISNDYKVWWGSNVLLSSHFKVKVEQKQTLNLFLVVLTLLNAVLRTILFGYSKWYKSGEKLSWMKVCAQGATIVFSTQHRCNVKYRTFTLQFCCMDTLPVLLTLHGLLYQQN